MDQTKLNEIRMLPLLDKGSRFESHDFLFGDFVFSNFDLHFLKINFYLFKGFFMDNLAHTGQISRKNDC
jgi:hypothetical protein